MCRHVFVENSHRLLLLLLSFAKKNPFTPGPFCVAHGHQRRGSSFCPHHYGRSKLLLQPQHHRQAFGQVHIHGKKKINPEHGIVHLDTSVAHLKEWPGHFAAAAPQEEEVVTVREPLDFWTYRGSETKIHSFASGHALNEKGGLKMRYDADLEPWLRFVASRGRRRRSE